MKTFSDTELKVAYEKASPETQDKVYAFETSESIDAVTTQASIENANKSKVAEEVLYNLIGLTNGDDLKARLKEHLSFDDQKAGELIDALVKAKVLSGEAKPTSAPNAPKEQQKIQPGSTLPEAKKPDLKERLELRPENAKEPTKEPKENNEGVSRPLTREELLKSLSTTRTMAKDIEAAKGTPGTPARAPTPQAADAAPKEDNK